MKSLILVLTLFSGFAQAQTVAQLQHAPAMTSCWANAFNADDSIAGFCKQVKSQSGGRGSNYTWTPVVQVATWDDSGVVTLGAVCATQAKYGVVIYAAGYSAANCGNYASLYNPREEITINGYPYAYLDASADGLYELVIGYVVAF